MPKTDFEGVGLKQEERNLGWMTEAKVGYPFIGIVRFKSLFYTYNLFGSLMINFRIGQGN